MPTASKEENRALCLPLRLSYPICHNARMTTDLKVIQPIVTPLNSKKPTPAPGGPGGDPPKEKSGDDKPEPRPFDAYWFGFYAGPIGSEQIAACNCDGWEEEFGKWINDQGFFHHELFPHRFIIGKRDPGTLKRVDLSRREFFQIQKQFELLTAKFGLCLSGMLSYSRQLAGKPNESYPEFYHMNHVRTGDSIGRPFRHRLP